MGERRVVATTDDHERARNFLTPPEVDQLAAAAKRSSRNPIRDELVIRMLFRHGLRESELAHLRTADVDLTQGRIWIARSKGSLSTSQPLFGADMRILRRWLKTRSERGWGGLPWLFVSERGGQMSRHTVIYIVTRAGLDAGLGHVTPHRLRHSCGFALAERGVDFRLIQDLMGHRDPRHTSRYTRTAAKRFEGVWGR